MNRARIDRIALAVVAVVLAIVPPALGWDPYYLRIATLMLIYMGYTVAFNVIFGHTRQLFLCLGALAGAAGYVSVVLTVKFGWTPWLSMPLGVALATLLGGVFSYVAVRRGLGVIFVGIVTLVFSMIFHNIVLGLRDLTNGETGIETAAAAPALLAHAPASYYAVLVVLLLALLVYHLLLRSRAGVAFQAIADDELAAALAGIDVTFHKVLAASVGSALLGVVGVIYAYYGGFISPTVYSLVTVDIAVLVALFLGGMGTLLGPVLGGLLFTVIDEVVRPLGQLNVLVYGVLIIVLVVTFRRGLVAMLRKVIRVRIP